jgi:hypothetical protein
MTTEILRNIMYRTAETAGEGGGSTRDQRLGDVGLVVLDEVGAGGKGGGGGGGAGGGCVPLLLWHHVLAGNAPL